MTHTAFSPDGSSLYLADVFGVTRFTLGKAVTVKHTAKATSSLGAPSLDAGGATLCVQGRAQTGAYGEAATTLLGAPALGVRAKLPACGGAQRLASPGGVDRVLTLEGDVLALHAVAAKKLARKRRVDLAEKAARALDALSLGDGGDGEQEVFAVAPDGGFVARGAAGLYAGRLGADARGDAVWWRLPLRTRAGDEVTAALDGDTAWVFARDPADDVVRCASIDRDGAVRVLERVSLCAPAVEGGVMLTQPESGVVVAHALSTGDARRHDVSKWNALHAERRGSAAGPARAGRLPGVVAVRGAARWFVPWHREFAVDLARGEAHLRGLDAKTAPFRRRLLSRLAAHDESLRALGISVSLSAYEPHPKGTNVFLATRHLNVRPGLTGRVVEALTGRLLAGCVFGASSFTALSTDEGEPARAAPASVGEVRAVLSWMRAHDVRPVAVAEMLAEAWSSGLGVGYPGDEVPEAFLTEGAGERILLRALLETLAAGGWPEGHVPDAWASEPPTEELVRRALATRGDLGADDLANARRALGLMLVRNLGAEAAPPLLVMLDEAARADGYFEGLAAVEDAVALLGHEHAALRKAIVARIDAAAPTSDDARTSLADLRASVARGRRSVR